MIPTLYGYLSVKDATAICKLAAQNKPKSRALEAVKAVGVPTLGFAGGAAIGFGVGQLADTLYSKAVGHPMPEAYLRYALPVLSGGLGLAYGLYRAHQQEDLRRALQSHEDESPVRGKLP